MSTLSTAEYLATPEAIAMWDFSWIERRYPGGGYENWGRVTRELVERGYDTVRIDAFPHLIGHDPKSTYRLRPCWSEHDWGAPFELDVNPGADLVDFIGTAADAGLTIAVSSWFREDVRDLRMQLTTPERFAAAWIDTLALVENAGLLDTVRYVDLANEFPIPLFNPFLYRPGPLHFDDMESRTSARLQQWMDISLKMMRDRFPSIPLCYSFATEFDNRDQQDLTGFDLLELHIWMSLPSHSEYYDVIGYDLSTSHNDPASYVCLAEKARAVYEDDPDRWNGVLVRVIQDVAQWSRDSGLPLVTTEAWSLVNWKDGDGLDWDWIKDLNEVGIRAAVATQRWASLTTSNFCGPQFRGMWEDVEWHRAMTDVIHAGHGPVLSVR